MLKRTFYGLKHAGLVYNYVTEHDGPPYNYVIERDGT